jgi:hypothetical protein
MNRRPPWDVPAADADDGTRSPAGIRRGGHLIAVTLLAAAALDLARCGLVLVTSRHLGPAAGLVAAGLAAAALSMWAARECRGGRRWSGWAALLIGAASGPQAAASGFHAPYTIPDTEPPLSWGYCWPWLSWPPPARTARPATTPKPRAPPSGEPPDDPTQPGRHAPRCGGPPLPPNPRGRPAARGGAALIAINPGIGASIESILRPLRELGMRPAGGHRRGSVACRPAHVVNGALFPDARLQMPPGTVKSRTFYGLRALPRLWRPAVPVSRGAGIELASGPQPLRRGTITL